MNLPWLLFSFKGRIGRGVFWIAILIWTAVFELVAHLDFFLGDSPTIEDISTVIILGLVWPEFAIQAKRWHDRNKSGWWILLGFVPIIGQIWVLVEVGFLGPIDEGNKY